MRVNKSSGATISRWFSKIGFSLDRTISIILTLGFMALIVLVFFIVFTLLLLRGSPEVSNEAVLVDLDGDGDLDLFAGKLAEETLVWLNDGQDEFTRQR